MLWSGTNTKCWAMLASGSGGGVRVFPAIYVQSLCNLLLNCWMEWDGRGQSDKSDARSWPLSYPWGVISAPQGMLTEVNLSIPFTPFSVKIQFSVRGVSYGLIALMKCLKGIQWKRGLFWLMVWGCSFLRQGRHGDKACSCHMWCQEVELTMVCTAQLAFSLLFSWGHRSTEWFCHSQGVSFPHQLNISRNVSLSGEVCLLSDPTSCQMDNTFTFSSGEIIIAVIKKNYVISFYLHTNIWSHHIFKGEGRD